MTVGATLIYFAVIFAIFAVCAFVAEQLDKRDRRRALRGRINEYGKGK